MRERRGGVTGREGGGWEGEERSEGEEGRSEERERRMGGGEE